MSLKGSAHGEQVHFNAYTRFSSHTICSARACAEAGADDPSMRNTAAEAMKNNSPSGSGCAGGSTAVGDSPAGTGPTVVG